MAVSFKVFWEDQVRRFKSDNVSDLDVFKSKIQQLFPNGPKEPTLKWKDSDGDLISITSHEEFQEAVDEQGGDGGGIVKVMLFGPINTGDINQNDQTPPKTNQKQNHEPEQEHNDESEPEPSPAVHPNVQCDVTGARPLKGMRFHKVGGNYDLVESEFLKLDESERIQYELILRPMAPPVRWAPVVHYGVTCDASETSPILGIRFHKIGENFDLCLEEFVKLSEKERRLYELIAHPDPTSTVQPIPYFSQNATGNAKNMNDFIGDTVNNIIGNMFPGLANMGIHVPPPMVFTNMFNGQQQQQQQQQQPPQQPPQQHPFGGMGMGMGAMPGMPGMPGMPFPGMQQQPNQPFPGFNPQVFMSMFQPQQQQQQQQHQQQQRGNAPNPDAETNANSLD